MGFLDTLRNMQSKMDSANAAMNGYARYFTGAPVITVPVTTNVPIASVDRYASERGYFRENMVKVGGGHQVTYRIYGL